MSPFTRNERGSYLVLAAFIMVVLIVVAGLAVDISRKFTLEQKCQDVADAAAMAGAAFLPNDIRARVAAETYIQQAAGKWYEPRDTDIQIVVDTAHASCTIGVLVKGTWDPVLMPDWLVGGASYGVARYAIAVMRWETTATTILGNGTFPNGPGGPYALFVGDTEAITSGTTGNNAWIDGSAHFNHAAQIQWMDITNGTMEVPAGSTINAGKWTGSLDAAAGYEAPPQINAAALVYDVLLDQTNANQAAYYAAGVTKNLVRPGPDGSYGTGDDIPIKHANGTNVTAQWTGTKWIVTTVNSQVRGSAGGLNTGIGAGVDLKINGSVDFNIPNAAGNYWEGSVQCSGKFFVNANNTELRCVLPAAAVSGQDNPGLGIYCGYGLPDNSLAFDNRENATNIYGVIYCEGTLRWDGNVSNPSSSNPASPPGTYTTVGNGFVQGSVYCDDMNLAAGGGSTGNNFKVFYDGVIAGGVPITNAPQSSPPRYSTPTVWLQK